MMVHRSAAATVIHARLIRFWPRGATSSHANAGTTNDSAVIRVRQAAAVAMARNTAFFLDGLRCKRTNAAAENVTVAMNTSSRHPSADHEINSYSRATMSDSTTAAGRGSIAAPSRYAAMMVRMEPVIDAKLTATF